MASPEQGARIVPWPRMPVRRGSEREFLPAALEIMETPASPLQRAIALTIVSFFCGALAWSWFGYVDIIATAQGRLVPTGKTKLVQPLEAGIVKAIHVQDGDHVRAGDVLVELDGTVTSADRARVAHDLLGVNLDVARLTALKGDIDKDQGASVFVPPKDARPHEAERARAALLAQRSEQEAKVAALEQQIDQKRAEAAEIAATIDKLKATLPLIQEKEALRERLLQQEYGNRFAFLDAKQQLLEAQHDLVVQNRRTVETDAARASLERQRDQARAEYAHKVLGDLSDAEQKLGQLTQDFVKAERKSIETRLDAPIDGVVQQLAVHTVGGVVTPAQQLMVVVPEDQTLIVEAMLPNRNVGFARVGQEVEIKVETFTFTRYGLIHGHVISISRDIVTDDRRDPERPGSGTTVGASGKEDQQAGASPSYMARIALDRDSILVDGKEEKLGPGMAVTAEIKTGRRRILDYLLSPLREYAQEAMRER
jgi:hemolysin D